jgi:uncharacterized protein with HEPN domain
MLDTSRKALALVGGKSIEEFEEDEVLRLAPRQLLRIVGEAASRVSPQFRTANPEVLWNEILGMRRRVVHDGTVTDRNTGLMWKNAESPELNWEDALRYCGELDLAGYTDWRLPGIRELSTLLDLSCRDGVWFHRDFFPGVRTVPLGFYWASTTYGGSFGWGVNFQFGYDGY